LEGLRPVLLILLSAYACLLHGQEGPAILWDPDHRLRWTDFKATAPPDSPVAATTASGIAYRFSALEEGGRMRVDCTVETNFYPESSWYRPGQANDVILSHEQLHFDISELFARRMRQRVAAYRFTSGVKGEMKRIYEETIRELRNFQRRYDQETNYSRDTVMQAKWNQKIAADLRSTRH
jgi:hypothetical protein